MCIRDRLKLYDTAMSNPYPLEWLGDCIKAYEIEDGKDLEKQEWFQVLWESVIQVLTQAEADVYKRQVKKHHRCVFLVFCVLDIFKRLICVNLACKGFQGRLHERKHGSSAFT